MFVAFAPAVPASPSYIDLASSANSPVNDSSDASVPESHNVEEGTDNHSGEVEAAAGEDMVPERDQDTDLENSRAGTDRR